MCPYSIAFFVQIQKKNRTSKASSILLRKNKTSKTKSQSHFYTTILLKFKMRIATASLLSILTLASLSFARVIESAPASDYQHASCNCMNKSTGENGQCGNNGMTGGGCDPNTLYTCPVGDGQPPTYWQQCDHGCNSPDDGTTPDHCN